MASGLGYIVSNDKMALVTDITITFLCKKVVNMEKNEWQTIAD